MAFRIIKEVIFGKDEILPLTLNSSHSCKIVHVWPFHIADCNIDWGPCATLSQSTCLDLHLKATSMPPFSRSNTNKISQYFDGWPKRSRFFQELQIKFLNVCAYAFGMI